MTEQSQQQQQQQQQRAEIGPRHLLLRLHRQGRDDGRGALPLRLLRLGRRRVFRGHRGGRRRQVKVRL